MEKSIHLGDGAYATFTGYDFLITASDHRPEYATDKVTLDASAIRKLAEFLKGREEDAEQAQADADPKTATESEAPSE